MILFALFVFIITGALPYYLDNASLYWSLDVGFHLVLLSICLKCIKSVPAFCVWLVLFTLNLFDFFVFVGACVFGFEPLEYWSFLPYAVGLIPVLFYVRKKLSWDRVKCDGYNPEIVQVVMVKPKNLITYLGALLWFDPVGSIMYTYKGKIHGFKKRLEYPYYMDYAPRCCVKYKNTNIHPQEFEDKVKRNMKRRFNLFRFNCRHLMK